VPVSSLALLGESLSFSTVGYRRGNYIVGEPGPFLGFRLD
jgi:hypothetical protein